MDRKSLSYLVDRGLHDANMEKFSINYNEKSIFFKILTKSEIFNMEFKGIKLLSIDKNDDFKNKEIILEFHLVNEGEISIFTTSNTSYRVCFEESCVYSDLT